MRHVPALLLVLGLLTPSLRAAEVPEFCRSEISLSLKAGHPDVLVIHHNDVGRLKIDWRGGAWEVTPFYNPLEVQLDRTCQLASETVTVTPSKCAVVGDPKSTSVPPPDTEPQLDIETNPPWHTIIDIHYSMPNAALQRRIRGVFLPTGAIIIDKSIGGTEVSNYEQAGVSGDVGPVLIKAIACGTKTAVDTTDTGGDKDCNDDCGNKCDGPPQCIGDPVNTSGLNMRYEDVDPLPGFALRRVYDSRTNRIGYFGSRWFSVFDAGLKVFDDFDGMRYVTVTAPDRTWMVFEGKSGTYRQIGPGRARDARLVQLADGTWRQTLPGGRESRDFNAGGNLAALRDVSTGRETRIVWAEGLPARVEDSWGNWALVVTTDAATRRITTIAPAGQPQHAWQYTQDLHLKRVDSPLGVWRTYEYDMPHVPYDRHRLVIARDGAGNVVESHDYHDDSGRTRTSYGPGGEIESIVVGEGRVPREKSTTVRYRNGRSEVHYQRTVAARWRTVEVVGGCATCGRRNQTVVYDRFANVIRSQAADGYITTHLFDGAGLRKLATTTAQRPVSCDPATAADRCRLTTDALATAELVATTATQTTSYTYADPNWPDRATATTTASVLNPGQMRRETVAYHPTTGDVLSQTIVGWTGEPARQETRTTTTALYNGSEGAAFTPGGAFSTSWLTLPQPVRRKSVDGPRTSVSDVTTFVHYPVHESVPAGQRGHLAAVRDALGHITRYEDYDAFGNARRVVDANGVVEQRTFDALGRLTTSTIKAVPGCDAQADPLCGTDVTRTWTFANAGPLRSEQRPGGGVTVYDYDSRGRVSKVSRGPSTTDLRERLEFTYDPLTGQKSAERWLSFDNGAWTERKKELHFYDLFEQLERSEHADASSRHYAYDAGGRLLTVRDENHASPNTRYEYDAAGRLVAVAQTLSGNEIVTRYGYDGHGNLTSVRDPNGNVTTYLYDDFGQLLRQVSPVTGTTRYTYGVVGQLLTTTHEGTANTTTRTYDVLGRVLSAVSTMPGRSPETVTWSYDSGAFGKGRVARLAVSTEDARNGTSRTVTTEYAWDRRGLLLSESQAIDNEKYTTGYGYDADGNRTRIAYPSGRIVQYTYDHAGRPLSASAGQTALVSAASYLPFGPLAAMTFGNGTVRSMTYDQRYRIETNVLTGPVPSEHGPPVPGVIASYDYDHDAAGNITRIADLVDPGFTRDFVYDDLDRLTTANGGAKLWGAGSYAYDAMGNLRSTAVGTNLRTFAMAGTTPKIASVMTDGRLETVTYDAAGNEIAAGSRTFEYSPRNHLSIGDARRYTYDGRGVRTTTTYNVTLSGFSIARPTASPNQTFSGTVASSEPAPAGGLVVRLTSSSRSVSVPKKVTVASGQTSAAFTVTVGQKAKPGTVTLTATFATTLSVTLSVVDTPPLASFTATPIDVVGGNPVTAAVTLAGPAPDGGAVIEITSEREAVGSGTIRIGGGGTSGSTLLQTYAVGSTVSAPLTATYGGSALQTTIQLRPVAMPDRLLLTPDSVIGGQNATGTITLAAPAPAGGRTFTLSSTNPATAQVPPSVTIPENAQSTAFTIVTSPVTSATPVTITAADPSVTLQSTLTVICRTGQTPAPSFPEGQTVFVDELLPSGAAISGVFQWDSSHAASGQFSLTAPYTGTGVYRGTIAGLYEPVSPAEKLFVYARVSECAVPRQLVVRARVAGAWVTAYWGQPLWGVGPDSIHMGPVPPSGSWVRLDVLLRNPADGDPVVSELELAAVDGQVWFDRIGRMPDCVPPVAARPMAPGDEDVIVDDTLPAGATFASSTNPPLMWTAGQAASGSLSLVHPYRGQATSVTGIANLAEPLVTGAKLSLYALVDSCSPPARQIHVRVTTTAGSGTASWGEALWDVDGATLQRGAVPAAGSWTRLEIPLDQLGLDGGTLTRIDVAHVEGRVWLDRIALWPLSGARLTSFASDRETTVAAGTTVTWTATAAGTVYPLQYRFDRRDDSGTWSTVQSYGPSNTYTWTPTAADVGSNAIRVSVRNAGSVADFEDTATLPLRVVEGEFGFAPHAPVSLGVHFGALTATSPALPRRHSLYSPELQLLAETEVTTASKPPVEYEYIWFAGEPLAQITTSTNEIHWYFNDHLGTPILQTASDAPIVWRVEYDPYGSIFSHRTAADKHQPLRFPGQEHDGASELTYNVFRWYRAGWGRYTQADPVGVSGQGHFEDSRLDTWVGSRIARRVRRSRSLAARIQSEVNGYQYAGANPLSFVDPRGLSVFPPPPSSGGAEKILCTVYRVLQYPWKNICGYVGKCIGVVTWKTYLAAGIVEVMPCKECSPVCTYESTAGAIANPDDWECTPPMMINTWGPSDPLGWM